MPASPQQHLPVASRTAPLKPNFCTHETHDAIKDDPARWTEETVAIGFLTRGGRAVLDLRNHVACGSTLARKVRS